MIMKSRTGRIHGADSDLCGRFAWVICSGPRPDRRIVDLVRGLHLESPWSPWAPRTGCGPAGGHDHVGGRFASVCGRVGGRDPGVRGSVDRARFEGRNSSGEMTWGRLLSQQAPRFIGPLQPCALSSGYADSGRTVYTACQRAPSAAHPRRLDRRARQDTGPDPDPFAETAGRTNRGRRNLDLAAAGDLDEYRACFALTLTLTSPFDPLLLRTTRP